jgi:hypothetical protein
MLTCWCDPVFEVRQANINSRDFVFGVVSRRSRYRAGTRYFSRGIDKNGHVSNFNETEQFTLLDHPDSKGGPVKGEIRASYAQIRGSVPIYWAEVNNLRYKPDLVIMDLDTTASLAHSEKRSWADSYASTRSTPCADTLTPLRRPMEICI